jgi:hypothetical protein
VFQQMAIEIVFASKSPQLPIISEAAGMNANPRFPVIVSAQLLAFWSGHPGRTLLALM